MQDQLKDVEKVQACLCGAFAAICGDGSVVSWGNADFGGDSRAVQDQLKNVQQILGSPVVPFPFFVMGSLIKKGCPYF